MPIRSGIRLRTLVISPWTAALAASLLVAGCSTAPVAPPSAGHLRAESLAATNPGIPSPVASTVTLPRPKAAAKTESYSVSVRNIPVQDLLFALSRDAKLNVDIHPGITGVVTLNAIDQTLQQILTRISKQLDMRWEIDGPNLIVMPDSPFLRTYKVDYVNMTRDVTSTVTVSSQISGGVAGASGSSSSNNNSESKIENKANNRFWDTLEKNIKDILRETDKILPEGSSETVIERSDQQATTGTGAQGGQSASRAATATTSLAGSPNAASLQQQGTTVVKRATFREAASVMANPEAGIINVRATARQHEKVREFLDQVMSSAQRQVLIEATIAEVELSDDYSQGIEWSRIASGIAGLAAGSGGTGIAISQAASGLFTLTGQYTTSSGGTFDGTIELLQKYGNVKVLSSPKLSVLNNQTAMLRVVTNQVYFTVKSDVAAGVSGSAPVKAVTTTPHTVAVGFVMAVTPQISSSNSITLNIRPSITSTVGLGEKDPNPELTIESRIPVIRTREMESILRVDSGNIVVMGGLMQDEMKNDNQGLPALSYMPLFGPLFQNRKDVRQKTELVIFLRPVIIKDASMQGDYAEYRRLLPGQDFFEKDNLGPPLQRLDIGGNPQ
jgi:general secretion pathway protein D